MEGPKPSVPQGACRFEPGPRHVLQSRQNVIPISVFSASAAFFFFLVLFALFFFVVVTVGVAAVKHFLTAAGRVAPICGAATSQGKFAAATQGKLDFAVTGSRAKGKRRIKVPPASLWRR